MDGGAGIEVENSELRRKGFSALSKTTRKNSDTDICISNHEITACIPHDNNESMSRIRWSQWQSSMYSVANGI